MTETMTNPVTNPVNRSMRKVIKTTLYVSSASVLAMWVGVVTGCGGPNEPILVDPQPETGAFEATLAEGEETGEIIEEPASDTEDWEELVDSDIDSELPVCEMLIMMDSVRIVGAAAGIEPLDGTVDWVGGIVSETMSFAAVRDGPQSETTILVDLPVSMFDMDKLVASSDLTRQQALGLLASQGLDTQYASDFATSEQAPLLAYEKMHGSEQIDPQPAHSFAAFVTFCADCDDGMNENGEWLFPFTIKFVATDGPVTVDGEPESGDVIVGEFDYLAPE